MIHCESCDSPPYFQHLLAPTNHPIYKVMLINQVLVDSVLRTNYLTITLKKTGIHANTPSSSLSHHELYSARLVTINTPFGLAPTR
jgi:hypothetical protein